jgi:isochorismate synthase EntC
MIAIGGESYWDRACRFFRSTGFLDTEGSYFLHNKNAATARVGIMGRRSVRVENGRVNQADDRHRIAVSLDPEVPVFKQVEKLVSRDAPCFLIASPDIKRRFADPSIPLIYLVQPAIEFTFSPERSEGHVSYACDSAHALRGESMLRAADEEPRSALPNATGELRKFSELIADWKPAESDEAFLERLVNAIGVLQDHPSGKLTLTRAYEHSRAGQQNPFGLYELYAGMAGEYACSHFVCIQPGVFSVGVTPENVFEVHGKKLTVDVVAATCRSNQDAAYVEELTNNAKQLKEHTSSLTNRQRRFMPFCTDDSIHVVQDTRVKKTRNVSHLHSLFTGELLSHVTVFDLMGSLFPLLGARPSELSAISDAEAAPHRYYGGVVGHAHGETGGCFLNIRTALFLDDVIHAKVGVGVLRESDAHSELVETRDKLSGLLEAFQLWAGPLVISSKYEDRRGKQ